MEIEVVLYENMNPLPSFKLGRISGSVMELFDFTNEQCISETSVYRASLNTASVSGFAPGYFYIFGYQDGTLFFTTRQYIASNNTSLFIGEENSQQIRDAMRLAPSSVALSGGSVDAMLEDTSARLQEGFVYVTGNGDNDNIPDWINQNNAFSEDATLPAIRSVIDAKLDTAGSGSVLFSISVRTGSSAAIGGAKVLLKSGSTTVAYGYANSSGVVPINLDAATYSITVTAPGFVTHTGTVVVASGMSNPTITMTAVAIDPPAEANLCILQSKALRSNVPVAGCAVKVYLDDTKAMIPEGVQLHMVRETVSASDGSFTLVLPWSSSILFGKPDYRIVVTDPDGTILHERRFRVTDVPSGQLSAMPAP